MKLLQKEKREQPIGSEGNNNENSNKKVDKILEGGISVWFML